MAEPKAQAESIESVLPWLQHWFIADERISDHRSHSYALRTVDGLMLIDPVPLAGSLQEELTEVGGIFLTHGNHQRAAWRLRAELGVRVHAPAGVAGLDQEPDVLFDDSTKLPGGLRAVPATGFQEACYLTFEHPDGTGVLFCGDLICRDPDGSYRFPVQPGYFDLEGGQADARRLSTLPMTVLCAAHAAPSVMDCRTLLEELAGT